MKMKIHLLAVFFLSVPLLSGAAEVPAGIKNNAYNRLLEKYVNPLGLVAYESGKIIPKI